MSEKQTFVLAHKQARAGARQAVDAAPDGWTVTVAPPKKTRGQEEKYHAMIGDIAQQVEIMGQQWHVEDMKRLLVDQFAREMAAMGKPVRNGGRVVPSLDGTGVVQLGVQTRKFLRDEAAAFIEYLFAFGAESGVVWTDMIARGYEDMV